MSEALQKRGSEVTAAASRAPIEPPDAAAAAAVRLLTRPLQLPASLQHRGARQLEWHVSVLTCAARFTEEKAQSALRPLRPVARASVARPAL